VSRHWVDEFELKLEGKRPADVPEPKTLIGVDQQEYITLMKKLSIYAKALKEIQTLTNGRYSCTPETVYGIAHQALSRFA